MKRILSAVCCVSMVVLPVLAQNHHKMGENKGAAMSDQQFVDFAAQTDMVEANLGQLVQQVSDQQPIKDYGQMLVTDHTDNYHQLTAAAQQANLTVPTAIDEANNKDMLDPFYKLKGAAFDKHFVPAMIAGHTKALEVFKKEAADAQNPAIKAYAEASIPVLQKHLDDAKDLEKSKAPAQ